MYATSVMGMGVWRLLLLAGLSLCIGPVAGSLYFEDGYDYHYTYSSDSDALGLHNVTTIMKLRIRCVNRTADGGSFNLLQLDSFVQHSEHGHFADNPMKWDLSRKLFFTVGDEGVVGVVHYHPDEEEEVLTLKKVLVGTLSANIKNQQGNRWTFKSEETDHAGHLEHEYEGTKTEDGIKLVRRHRSTERVHRQHDKTMLLDIHGTPHFIDSFDNITLLSPEPQEKRKVMAGEQVIHDFESGEFPIIGTTSRSKLKLAVKRRHLEPVAPPVDMIQDTVQVKPKIPEKVSLADVEDRLQDLLECIHSHTDKNDKNRTECVSNVRQLIYSLHKDDFITVGKAAITRRCAENSTRCIDERKLFLDLIGSEGSPEAQHLIVDNVLKLPNVTEDDLQRCLVHCVVLSHPIAELVHEVEKLCFDGKETFQGVSAMTKTQRRACLAQGTLANALHTMNVTESDRLVQALEDWLQPHNQSEAMRIIKPRLRRSLTEDDDGASAHVETKMILLHSLGNAGKQRSLGHILSYMEPSIGITTWRRAAINSLRHFTCNESATALVTSAVYDDNDLVRQTALHVYRKHPLSSEKVVDHENLLLSKRYTYPMAARIRRGVLDDLISFHIQTPSKQWGKNVGNSNVGSSFGLHTKNLLDLKMGILSGHFEIDVDNGAFAEAHVGLIDLNVDIFKASVCFGGHIEYNLNPLKDFGIDSIQDLVNIFDKIVDTIVTPIDNAIDTFGKIVDVLKDKGPLNVVNGLVVTVKELPHVFLDAPRKIREFVEYAYRTTGSVIVEEIKHIAQNIRHLIDSIQQDVLKFYNDIVDAVTMALPYIGKKIVEAFNLIWNGFRQIFQNPMQAITSMWRAVTQVKMAVAMIVDVKNKIVESCMFLKGRASEWLNGLKAMPQLFKRMAAAIDKLSHSIQARVPTLEANGQTFSNGIQTLEDNGRALVTGLQNKWDEVLSYLNPMLKATEPFMDLFQSVMKLIKDSKSAYMAIKNAIQTSKSRVQRVFGPKFNYKFPREPAKAHSGCPAGVWPTTSGGHYTTEGVDLKIGVGDTVVAPVDGIIQAHPQEKQIVIQPTDPEFESYEIIIHNIEALPDVDEQRIRAGKDVGVVTSAHVCGSDFIHVSVRQAEATELPDDEYEYVDPSPFLDTMIPVPKWKQDCNEFEFRYIGQTSDAGKTGDNSKSLKDKLKRLGNNAVKEIKDKLKSYLPKLPSRTRRSSIGNSFKKGLMSSLKSETKKFMSLFKTGLFGKNGPKIPNILEIVDLSGKTLEWILGRMEVGSTLHTVLTTAMADLSGAMNAVPQGNPVTLGMSYLRKLAADNGIPDSVGDVVELAGSILAAPEKKCPLFKGAIASAYGHMCTAHSDCLGISCSVALWLGQFQYVKLEVSTSSDGSIKLTIDGRDMHLRSDGLECKLEYYEPNTGMMLTLVARAYIADGAITLDAEAKLCNTLVLTCVGPVEILTEIRFNISMVRPVRTERALGVSSSLNGMTIPQFLNSNGEFGLLSSSITNVLQNVRETVVDELLKEVEDTIGDIVKEFKDKIDVCIDGQVKPVHFDMNFFDTDKFPVPLTFPIGPIVIGFRFRADGTIGLGFELKICILSMKTQFVLIPSVSGSFTGEININVGFAKGGLGITGIILDTQFPITAELSFAKFPIRLSAKMDMIMVPLGVKLFGFADLFVFIKYIRVFEANIWEYSTPTIRKNVFTLPGGEEDKSPPEPRPNTVRAISKRESSPGGCIVKQIAGRSPDDTAFSLEFHAEDPTSDISMTYAVGTHIGGTDVLGWTEMKSSILSPSKMPAGVQLYWTVKAKNSQGLALTTQCSLETYDNTIPDGRVEHSYKYSSHPSQLSAAVVVFEDSPLQDTHFKSVGYSPGKFGAELVNWSPLQLGHSVDRVGVTGVLKQFNEPREGKLIAYILQSEKVSTPDQCAQRCITFGVRCVSFDYETHSETCDLHDAVQGANAFLRISGTCSNYERLGTGYNTLIEYTGLPLTHGTTYFVNTQVTNALGYVAYLVGDGTMVDFTPPEPGTIANNRSDIFRADGCTAAVTQRCIHVTANKNHRIVVDGAGSATVFNGHEPLLDELYTLTNHYISANWNGFHDDESGIWGYTWAVGTSVCGTDVLPYTDPYTHLTSKKFWTDSGFHKGIHLEDGAYYVTVQALNGAELGGSLVTTVCHSTPFIVDTSPPLFNGVTDIIYDEDFDLIAVYYDAKDDLSKIDKAEFGLGKTKYDVQLKPYSLHAAMMRDDPFLALEDLGLKEGIPAWLRVRVTNNVDLFTAGHSDEPILIDRSPPIAGTVLDGFVLQHDIQFQSDNKQICAQWRNFYDPESGIDKFVWGVGSHAGEDDIVKFHNMTHYEKSGCTSSSLEHNHTYYSTVYSYNNALNSKANISMSDGVLVDLTPPLAGHVTDGTTGEPEMNFTSETVSKHCHWDGYHDPESGIESYMVDVYINNERKGSFNVGGSEEFHDNTVSLEHMDNVYFTVHGTNGADLEIASRSDGFLVDHTAPRMTDIYDTKDGSLFQNEDHVMHVGWNFQDEESGIKEYRTVIYESKFGVKQTVWPTTAPYNVSKSASPSYAKVNTRVDQLSLTNGATYSVHVTAMNGAMLSTSHESPGVTVDTSPPNPPHVHIGLAKDDEQRDAAGNILHDDQNGIRVSWTGRDAESGIAHFFVAVGTTTDHTQLANFTDYGEATTAYVQNIHFEPTNTSGILYVVSVKAVNGAGLESAPNTSGNIHVQKANVPGIVFDGRNIYEDEMYSYDHDSIAASFYGFESESCNIVGYEWGIGTEEYGTDVLTFTNYGLVMENDTHGFAQIHTDIYEDTTYYVTIRAVTGCHNGYIVSSSDGITIDSNAPEIVYDMSDNDTNVVLYDGVIYQADRDVLVLLSNVTDEQHVSTVQWALGSLPLEDDIHEYTDDYRTIRHFVNLVPGKSVFLTTNASDSASNVNCTSSVAIIADDSPPILHRFRCTHYVSIRKSMLTCNWDRVEEVESPVDAMKISIGTQPQLGDILDLYAVPHGVRQFTRDLITYIKMYPNSTNIYVDVSVTNVVGHRNDYEVRVVVDNTAPTATAVDVVTRMTDVLPQGHQECQWATSYMELTTRDLVDAESGIDTDRFEVSVGTLPFGSDILPFTTVLMLENGVFFLNGFMLTSGSVFHATLRSYNKAGLFLDTTTARVVVSTDPHLSISDGDGENDVDFQSVTNVLQGHWKYSDLCPIKHAYWQVQDIVGRILVDFQEIPGAANDFYNDEVKLENGAKYISVIKTIDALNRTKLARSDGISVRIQPPTPALVRDGLEEDLNYQFSTTELSANWDVFGDMTADPTQQIHHYEVAIGNDRRYSRTRTNVHYFENVGQNTTYTFEHLNLTVKLVKYYITVRAVSVAGGFAEGYSNGIRVGFRGTIIHGDIYSNNFQFSTDSISFSWTGFYSDIGIIQYKTAISSNDNFLTNDTVDCKLITLNESMFDINPLTSAGMDEYITVRNMHLLQNELYYPTVIAEDESGMCTAVTGSPIRVDNTPPLTGTLFVNELFNSSILFATSASQLNIRWDGFEDPESGIRNILVNVFECTSCTTQPISSDGCISVAESLVTNDMKVTLYELDLDTDKTYFVRIIVKNHAGLNLTAYSSTILQDQSRPLLGTVRITNDWNTLDTFQSSTNVIQGLLAIAPTYTAYECSQEIKYFPQSGTYNWDTLRNGFSSDFQVINQTGAYLGIGYNADLSGITKSGISEKYIELHTGNYSVHMKAAKGANIITTFAFMSDTDAIPFAIDNKPIEQQFDWGSFANISGLVAPDNDTMDDHNTTVANTTTPLTPELRTDNNDTRMSQQNTTLRNTDFAFGIHILGYTINENIAWHHLFWARSRFSTINEWFRMDNDPALSQNIYAFNVKQSQSTLDSYLDISLMVNGKVVVTTTGFKFPSSFKLAALTWNEDNYMPPIDDVYHPFYTDAIVSSIYVPDTRVKPCRHGRGFYDGESGIQEIWTGVSDSNTDVGNVSPLQLAYTFCFPCQQPCVDLCKVPCSDRKPGNEFQILPLNVNGLTLKTVDIDDQCMNITSGIKCNGTTYYLNVKAVNFAGKSTIAYSNAIQVDVTPPTCSYVKCLDPEYSEDEPTSHMGSSSTIGAYWNCSEDVGQIQYYTIAVTTADNTSVLMDTTNVGHTSKVRFNLGNGTFIDRHDYMLHMSAVNTAGLRFTSHCSVHVNLYPPSIGNSTSGPLYAYANVADDPVETSDYQNRMGVSWTGGQSDTEFYEWQLGTGPENSDIFPPVKVGMNASGTAAIVRGKLHLDSQPTNTSVSEFYDMKNLTSEDMERRQQASERQKSFFYMEPGRCVYQTLYAIGYSHLKQKLDTKPVCIKRSGDIQIKKRDGIHVVSKQKKANSWQAGKTSGAEISVQLNVLEGELLLGSLDAADKETDYGSAATSDFLPYISDPQLTDLGPSLQPVNIHDNTPNRITTFCNVSFYVSPTPVMVFETGQVNVTVPPGCGKDADLQPALIYWDVDTQQWIHNDEGCRIHLTAEMFGNVYTSQLCVPTNHARKRSTAHTLSRARHMELVHLLRSFPNHAPSITTDTIQANEDGFVPAMIDTHDSENDKLMFDILRQPEHAACNISAIGVLNCTLDEDFYGDDDIEITITELGLPPYEEALSDTKTIDIVVNGEPDPTERLYIDQNGRIFRGKRPRLSHSLVVEANTTGSMFAGTIILADKDGGEVFTPYIHFSGLENSSYALTAVTRSDIPNRKLMYTNYRTLKAYNVDIQFSPASYGKIDFNFISRTANGSYTPSVSLEVYVLLNPCVHGRCSHSTKPHGCDDNIRAQTFSDYYCACEPGYNGEWCQIDINECAPTPCALMFDCQDLVNAYSCNINVPKLMAILVCSLIAVGGAIFLVYRLVKRWKNNKVAQSRISLMSNNFNRTMEPPVNAVSGPLTPASMFMESSLAPLDTAAYGKSSRWPRMPEDEVEVVDTEDVPTMAMFTAGPGLKLPPHHFLNSNVKLAGRNLSGAKHVESSAARRLEDVLDDGHVTPLSTEVPDMAWGDDISMTGVSLHSGTSRYPSRMTDIDV